MKTVIKKLGLTGIGLCVLCCALPIIGAAVGLASLSVAAFYLEKIGIGFLLLAGSLLVYYAFFKKKMAAPSCSVDCSCTTNSSEK